jgi:hypothetical protein
MWDGERVRLGALQPLGLGGTGAGGLAGGAGGCALPACPWSARAPLARLESASGAEEGAELAPSTARPPAPDTLSLLDGKFSFPLAALPCIGPPDAEHLVVAITGPTCRHCRRAEEQLAAGLALYPEGSLAIVFLPAARDTLFGPGMQQILLTLWREAPEAWALFHADIVAGRQEVTLEALLARAAAALGGAEALDRALRSHQAANGELIRLATELAGANAAANEHDFAKPRNSSARPWNSIGSSTCSAVPPCATGVRRVWVD